MKRCTVLFLLLLFTCLLLLPSAFARDAGTISHMGTTTRFDNAQRNIFIDGEINYKKVLEILYGDLTYENDDKYDQPAIWNNIRAPWNEITYNTGLVFVAFEGKYTENGIQKYIILTQTVESEDATCHACAPIVGGAVFARYDNRWILESENKYIAVMGNWGWMVLPDGVSTETFPPDSSVDLIKIGPDKHGIYYKGSDFNRGTIFEYIHLIVPYKNTIIDSLDIVLEIPEGSYDCEDNQFAENDLGIHLVHKTNEASDYYDFTVVKQMNEGSCSDRNVRSVKESTNYAFVNGYYKKVQH